MSFPTNFIWGAATAAYQVEGAADADGKGPSVWDMLCRDQAGYLNPGQNGGATTCNGQATGGAGGTPRSIKESDSGDIACDHYHRYREDVALMQSLGLQAYRFSVSWPRVIPDGVGAVNTAGLDFYDRLVDALLAAGITPFVTLFHFDFPYALFERGWWLNRDSANWFAEYTGVVAERLSDRVQHWITLNEPQGFVGAYLNGRHAPGNQITWREALQAAHHTLLAHGQAVQMLRARAKSPAQISLATSTLGYMPATDAPADVDAARQAAFAVKVGTLAGNAWWLDPICLGHYPEAGLQLHAPYSPHMQAGDMETIHQPLDFLGLNLYNAGEIIRAGANGQPESVPFAPGMPRAQADWIFVTPAVLRWMPQFLAERYHLPLVITENGMANVDWVMRDGQVHDPQRIDFLGRYLCGLHDALQAGVDVRGYFYWTLMDNFEWLEGYSQRFGLVHVDFETQQRTPKDSAYWYRDVIASNGEKALTEDIFS